jgi:hypothetical protein
MLSSNLSYLPGAFICEDCEKKHRMQGSQEWSEEVDDGYDADDEDEDEDGSEKVEGDEDRLDNEGDDEGKEDDVVEEGDISCKNV